ncbi:MAG: hypothetical protein HY289_13695 [Planctomycetes bacterium]|nr:hypothetical protein [Planctomycetota bacterium]
MRQPQETHVDQPLQPASDLAHQKLDAAVFAAYGWDPALSDEDILAKLLELNLQRAKG